MTRRGFQTTFDLSSMDRPHNETPCIATLTPNQQANILHAHVIALDLLQDLSLTHEQRALLQAIADDLRDVRADAGDDWT